MGNRLGSNGFDADNAHHSHEEIHAAIGHFSCCQAAFLILGQELGVLSLTRAWCTKPMPIDRTRAVTNQCLRGRQYELSAAANDAVAQLRTIPLEDLGSIS